MLLPETINFDGPLPRLSRRLRLGIVGGGRISVMQAMAARLTGRWDIMAGAFSSDPIRAKAAAAEWHLSESRCYNTYEEMAAAEAARADGIDAVMITTPNHLHCPVARAFLKTGIDVLCDKPMTVDVPEAEGLVRLAEETGCVLGVSYVMSCFPMIRQAREIVTEGGIGTVIQMHVEFLQDWLLPPEVQNAPHVQWRLDPARSGPTSCVGDIGTHAAHLAEFVSRLPLTHLRAEFHVCAPPKPMEDTFFAWTRHNGSVPGTLMATRLAAGNRGGLRLRVFGTEGGLEWNLEACEQLKFSRSNAPDRILSKGHGLGISPRTERLINAARGFAEGTFGAWANLYTEFALAVAARRDQCTLPPGYLEMPTVSSGADGMRFVDACVRSNDTNGAWVAL